jgi:hypothetical protein
VPEEHRGFSAVDPAVLPCALEHTVAHLEELIALNAGPPDELIGRLFTVLVLMALLTTMTGPLPSVIRRPRTPRSAVTERVPST